jgi:hypothetical protein
MKKFAICIALIALAAFAVPMSQAATRTFTFDSFCDGMTLTAQGSGGSPSKAAGGTHNNYDCAGSFNYVGGFQHHINPNNPPYVDQVFDISDPTEGLFGAPYSGQFLVKYTPTCVWANYYNDAIFGGDGTNIEVYLVGTCTFSGMKAHGTGTRSTAPSVK